MRPPAYKDLGNEPEDERIRQIGEKAMKDRLLLIFVVDEEPDSAKLKRYLRKLEERFPGIRVIGQGKGPVPNSEWAKVGPPVN